MNKIAILGSTGSIGKSTLRIIKKNKKNFKICLLSANSDVKTLLKQAIEFNVKNVILKNCNNKNIINIFNKKKIKIYNNFSEFNKIFRKRIDYVINGISGLDGLIPTLNIIKYTKNIAIANKESIICGWNLISNELKKYKTDFIPIDSEHFSINELIKNKNIKSVKKIIITASGGPFLKRKNFKNIKINDALNHPNWKMGKKISIDSSTMVNKVFEVIEAKKIFNLNMSQIDILINPNSYVHSLVIFNNGTIKILAHENTMDIPIFNSIHRNNGEISYNINKLNYKKINNLNLVEPSIKQFKTLKILKLIPDNNSLFETILITINDELVDMFLKKKIEYKKISTYLMKIINFKKFKKYCNVTPKSVNQIFEAQNDAKKFINNYLK